MRPAPASKSASRTRSSASAGTKTTSFLFTFASASRRELRPHADTRSASPPDARRARGDDRPGGRRGRARRLCRDDRGVSRADDVMDALVLRFEEEDGIAKLARCTANGLDVELFHILTFT